MAAARSSGGSPAESMVNGRSHALVTIEDADESALTEVRAKPDVRELSDAEANEITQQILGAQRGAQ